MILGQAVSNSDVLLPAYRQFLSDRGPKRVSPFTLPQSNANVGATTVSEMFRLKDTCLTIATACTSATHAMGISTANIAAGVEDVILTGGAELALEPYIFSRFGSSADAHHVVAPDPEGRAAVHAVARGGRSPLPGSPPRRWST